MAKNSRFINFFGSIWILFMDLLAYVIQLLIDQAKGQLISEWIYEVIISPKMPTKNFKDFFPTKQTKIVALFLVIFWWV